MNNLISLKNYLDKDKTFVIPNYQRGYVWGKSNIIANSKCPRVKNQMSNFNTLL